MNRNTKPETFSSVVGTDITMHTTGDTLIVHIPLTQEHGPSSTGTTIIVGSTQGNARVPGQSGVSIGINCYHKPNVVPVIHDAPDTNLGDNVTGSVSKGVLTLTIDTSKRLGSSSSGKTTIVGSTRGPKQVPGCSGLSLGVNAYVK